VIEIGKCSNCGKKIQYNKFKMYRDKVLCYECYDTRLERKKAKKKAKKELEAKEVENVANNLGYNDFKIEEQEKAKEDEPNDGSSDL